MADISGEGLSNDKSNNKSGIALRTKTTEGELPENAEPAAFHQIKQMLVQAFAEPSSSYITMTAETIIARNRKG